MIFRVIRIGTLQKISRRRIMDWAVSVQRPQHQFPSENKQETLTTRRRLVETGQKKGKVDWHSDDRDTELPLRPTHSAAFPLW